MIDRQTKEYAIAHLVWLGFSKKQAQEHVKTAPEGFIREYAKAYLDMSRKTFYED